MSWTPTIVPKDGSGIGSGGSGPVDPNVALSDRVVKIETTLEHLATKADLAQVQSDIVKWIVGTALAIAIGAVTVMTFVLNNAVPKSPAPSTQPIVVVVPSSPQEAARPGPMSKP